MFSEHWLFKGLLLMMRGQGQILEFEPTIFKLGKQRLSHLGYQLYFIYSVVFLQTWGIVESSCRDTWTHLQLHVSSNNLAINDPAKLSGLDLYLVW